MIKLPDRTGFKSKGEKNYERKVVSVAVGKLVSLCPVCVGQTAKSATVQLSNCRDELNLFLVFKDMRELLIISMNSSISVEGHSASLFK